MGWWAAVGAIISIGSTLFGASKQNKANEQQAKAAAAEAAYNIRAAERQIGSIQRALQLDELRGEDIRSNIEYARREGYLFAARADFTASQAGLFEKRAGHSERQAGFSERQAGHRDRIADAQDDRADLHRGRAGLHDIQGQENKNRSVLSLFQAQLAQEGAEGQLFNAEVQETLADDALVRGEISAETIRLKEEAHVGTQKANAAARGVDVHSGSATDLTSSTKFLSEREQAIVERTAQREAFLHKVQGYNYRTRAGDYIAQTLGHKQTSRQATLDADKSYQSSEEAKATARETNLAATGSRIAADGSRLAADGSRLAAGELRNRAQGAIFSAEGLRNQAIGSELKAQSLITVNADRLRKRADAFEEQEGLLEKQQLFALQGAYGVRAAGLQNDANTITALGNIAQPVYNLVRTVTDSASKY